MKNKQNYFMFYIGSIYNEVTLYTNTTHSLPHSLDRAKKEQNKKKHRRNAQTTSYHEEFLEKKSNKTDQWI